MRLDHSQRLGASAHAEQGSRGQRPRLRPAEGSRLHAATVLRPGRRRRPHWVPDRRRASTGPCRVPRRTAGEPRTRLARVHHDSGAVDLRDLSQRWTWTPGASWRKPEGPGSSLAAREDHPVVHVAYEDAQAFAAWAGKALPTEAQWERAARGCLDAATYVWGDAPEDGDERLADYWHGDFPWRPDAGYGDRSPVGTYPPNGYGLHDMAGNVWEWTSDW
jgi:formylglycine-generating enzyme required for sulfatase activity